MSLIKTKALVLNSINWQESSKIITLYTRESGKVSIIARGARKLNNSYSGILESLNLVEVIIHTSSKRQIQILGSASLENGFPQIKKNLEKTGYSYAILELVSNLIESGSADEVFFDFVVTLLEQMAKIEDPIIIFCFFLLKISSYLGFRPEFHICTHCDKSIGSKNFVFSVNKGGVICEECGPKASDGWQLKDEVRNELFKVQNLNYKSISSTSFRMKERFNYIEFLLSYLRYHSDERLELKSLKFLK